MNIIYLLIGTSIVIAISFLAIFIWSVRSGQYDDSYTPSVRMLFDDQFEREEPEIPESHDKTMPVN